MRGGRCRFGDSGYTAVTSLDHSCQLHTSPAVVANVETALHARLSLAFLARFAAALARQELCLCEPRLKQGSFSTAAAALAAILRCVVGRQFLWDNKTSSCFEESKHYGAKRLSSGEKRVGSKRLVCVVV